MEIIKTVENRVHVLKAKTEDFLVANDMEQLRKKSLVNRVLDRWKSEWKRIHLVQKRVFKKSVFKLNQSKTDACGQKMGETRTWSTGLGMKNPTY